MGEIPRSDGLDFQVPERTLTEKLVDAREALESLEEGRKRMRIGPGGVPLSDLRSGKRPRAEGEHSS